MKASCNVKSVSSQRLIKLCALALYVQRSSRSNNYDLLLRQISARWLMRNQRNAPCNGSKLRWESMFEKIAAFVRFVACWTKNHVEKTFKPDCSKKFIGLLQKSLTESRNPAQWLRSEKKLNTFLQRHCIPKYLSSQLTPPPIFQNRRCHQEHSSPLKWVFLIKPPPPAPKPDPPNCTSFAA